ncbi:MAG: hypothetical protein HY825_20455 [Acidobacteria bacterium]|nr:hypothetical protein [Acidobacteriota bacterium]
MTGHPEDADGTTVRKEAQVHDNENRNQNLDRVDDFAGLLRAFRSALAGRDPWEAARLAKVGIDRLPAWLATARRRPPAPEAAPAPIPADFLQQGCLLLGCAGDEAGLAAARSAAERVAERDSCRAWVERGELALRTAELVLRLVAERPGIAQSDLARSVLGVDDEFVSEVCFWLCELGRLDCRGSGTTRDVRGRRMTIPAGESDRPAP